MCWFTFLLPRTMLEMVHNRSITVYKFRPGFPISIFVVGGALLSPLGGGEQRVISGGSCLYQLKSTYQNLQSPFTLLWPYSSPFLRSRGKTPVKHKRKYVLNGYWGVLFKENYVALIPLEPWLNVFPLHVPDLCKVSLTSNVLEEATYITVWPLFS